MALSCKHYQKQDYSTHVVNNSTSDTSSASPDHCRFFALSDPKKEQLIQSCLHSHLIECDRCQELHDLFLCLEEERGKISERCPMASGDICDLRFLVDDSKDKIEQWKAHILRSVNQEEGKKEVLDKLEPFGARLGNEIIATALQGKISRVLWKVWYKLARHSSDKKNAGILFIGRSCCPCVRQLQSGPDRSGFNYPEHCLHLENCTQS